VTALRISLRPSGREMLFELGLFLVGLIILLRGADVFVESAARIAAGLGVSRLVVGLTIVAFGTSIPEFASSVTASVKGEGALVIGNIIGSNIANIGLIIGLSAVYGGMVTTKAMLRRDGLIMFLSALTFYVLMLSGGIHTLGGLSLILCYLAYIGWLADVFRFAGLSDYLLCFMDYFSGGGWGRLKKSVLGCGLIGDVGGLFIGGLAVFLGANLAVDNGVFLAQYFGVGKQLIGVTLLSVGTSAPELSVSIAAARRKYGDIVVGNVIGSNIANILLVGGASALLLPLEITSEALTVYAPFMCFMSAAFLMAIGSGWVISRREGFFFFTSYALFVAYAISVG
jgi:cation:H+ antiporter